MKPASISLIYLIPWGLNHTSCLTPILTQSDQLFSPKCDCVKCSQTHISLWLLALLCPSLDWIGIGVWAVRAILQWPHIVGLPPCSCAGSVASQENSGVSAHRQGLLEALATCQTTMGGPVFFHRKHSHKSPLGISPIYVNVTTVYWSRCKIFDADVSEWESAGGPWNTIYTSFAEKHIAPWSWRALYNQLKRHRPASDHVVFVCVYVQVARLPLLPWQVPLGTLVFLYLDCSSYIPLALIKSHIYVCVCLYIRGQAWWEQLGKERTAGFQLSPSFLSQQHRRHIWIKSFRSEEFSIFKSS